MYYYDAFYVVGAMIAVFALLMIFIKKLRGSPVFIGAFIVCAALVFALLRGASFPRNFARYETMLASDSIVISDDFGTSTAPFHYDGPTLLENVEKAPVFVNGSDTRTLCRVELRCSENGSSVRLRLCRLLSTKGYPEYTYFTVGGYQYCLLSERPLYRGAMLVPPEEFSVRLLRAAVGEP
ncbi:MAG: hypothetical protein IKG85_08790 [Clostridia bacterium]|nr:hypothetical protein [Clostridia bacterium]